MARMIPPLLSEECRSPGEREIFRRLREDPVTEGWFVLHSLDVARHMRQVVGEIDFVIVVPQKGVLCLEVKACRELHRVEGLWYYGPVSSVEPDSRGPFRQVAEAMHSMRGRLATRAPALSGVPFLSGVVFPYVEFNMISEEWHNWQIIDARSFKSHSFGELVRDMVERGRDHLARTPTTTWFDAQGSCPDERQAEALVQVLRPDFEFYQSPKARIQQLDEEVKRYTTEQFEALDALRVNQRVLFEGPAGTGKTILALETVRRASSEGRRILFLCFNRLLARRLSDDTSGLPSVTVATLHRHMLNSAGHEPPTPAPEVFWERDLPQQAIECLLAAAQDTAFEELVLDEAQDIIREEYLDFLDLSLKGGLAAGTWRFFGDFERQALYGSDSVAMDALLHRRAGGIARYSLRVNCRNTPRIAEIAQLLGGLNPRYRNVLRPDDGVDPELIYYSDGTDQGSKLASCLERLYEEGFRGTDVTVLSARAHGSCSSMLGNSPWRERLRPMDQVGSPAIGYCSIHAFKGLESRAIVVTDIERIGDPTAQALFYVAATRALHRLVILAHQSVRNEARAIVKRQLE